MLNYFFLEYIWPVHSGKAKFFYNDMKGCTEVVHWQTSQLMDQTYLNIN